MSMEIIAKSNSVRQSPQKVRVIANLVKKLPLSEALLKLEFSPKKGAGLLFKTLKSAQSNAWHNHQLKKEDLQIKEIQVGPGPTLKRMKPRARGKGDVIRKRSSNIRVVLKAGEK